MSGRPGVPSASIILAVVSLLASAAVRADDSVYESASDIEIGRVFLTAAERERLDRRRLLPAATATTGGPATTAPSSMNTSGRQRRPAGYIVSSSGERRDWAGDRFVANESRGSKMQTFPGDVKIVRHVDDGRVADRADEADSQGTAPSSDTPSGPAEPHSDVSGNRK